MSRDGKPPRGWTAVRIDEVADVRFSSVDKNIVDGERTVKLCNYMDVWKNSYIHSNLDFSEGTATEEEFDRFSLQVGDVLLTKDSETREEIAEPSVVQDKIDNLVLGYHLALVRPIAGKAHGPFLAAQLRVPEFRTQLIRAASGITRYGLGMDALRSTIVWLPSPELQHRISHIIRSTDDLIDATQTVIRQLENVKTALLDKFILTGLPKKKTIFTEHYLGELFEERKERGRPGLPTMSVTMNGGLVDRESLDRRVLTELTPQEHLLVRKGDIAYNMMRMWQGVFGLARYDGIVSPAYVVLKPKTKINSQYAYYLFSHRTTIRKFERFSQGLTEDRLRLYYDQFAQIPVEIPDLNSQSIIAATLQSVDDRIAAEEARLNSLKLAKTALSQGLLTGRIPMSEGT